VEPVDQKREVQIVGDLLEDLEIDRREYANGLVLNLRRVRAANASLEGAGLAPIEFEWSMPNTDVVDYSFDAAGDPGFAPDQLKLLWTFIVLGYFPTPSTSNIWCDDPALRDRAFSQSGMYRSRFAREPDNRLL